MDLNSMQDIWNRLEVWLGTHAPALLNDLQPGATDLQIAAAEEILLIQFPEDIKASFKIHNGQSNFQMGLMDGRELLSLERIVDEWTIWNDLLNGGDFDGIAGEPGPGIKGDWWNPQWIPITYDGSGNHDCLDMDPTDNGHPGQIIDFWHDDPSRLVKAPSFGAWFKAFVEGCETGQCVYSEEYGGIVSVDDV